MQRAGVAARVWAWPVIVVAAALVPVYGVFTASRVFHVRDLSHFFWPRYLWARDALRSGHLSLWDPYPAAGQAAFSDPLYHLFFPPALLARLALPEVVGFNLFVALPLPVAAAGAYLLFRERFAQSAAALGALIFVFSGPVAATVTSPNFSWSVALMPWVLWAGGRAAGRGGRAPTVLLAALVALQALAAEFVTLAATLALLFASVAFTGRGPAAHRLTPLIAGTIGGMLAAAVQLLPTAAAMLASARTDFGGGSFWSLHPLAAVELLLPQLFGDLYRGFVAEFPWMPPLNSGRDPLFYSIYVGVGALMLACCAARETDARWVRFWRWVVIVAFVCALGRYSPFYSALQALVPPLESLRYPVKHLTVVSLAVGALAAAAWTAIEHPTVSRLRSHRVTVAAAGTIGAAALLVAALLVAEAESAATALRWLARRVGVEDIDRGVAFLISAAPPLLLRLTVLAIAGTVLLWIAAAGHHRSRVAAHALFALALLDPLLAHIGLNPTLPATLLQEPQWVTAAKARSDDRVYAGTRIPDPSDPDRLIDGPRRALLNAELSTADARTLNQFQLVLAPSAWRLRDSVSYDLSLLWPREYREALKVFSVVDAPGRLRFLRRMGVRYCLVGEPFDSSAHAIVNVPGFDELALYECNPQGRRALVADTVAIEPDPLEAVTRLFEADLPADALLLAETPPTAAGRRGVPGRASATILDETPERVTLRAVVGPDGGYLLLRDTFDSGWQALVDGERAPILRGNVLFRAVRLAPGEHVVEFRYEPTIFYLGAGVSLLALVGLVPWRRPKNWRRQRKQPLLRSEGAALGGVRGFTLVELLIVVAVIAIIAAIAIPGLMRSRQAANEASAVSSIRSINNSEVSYAIVCAGGGYAQALADLALAPPGGEPFLSVEIGSGRKSGYQFALAAYAGAIDVLPASSTCNGSSAAAVSTYHASGVPLDVGQTGQRSFATDPRGTIYEDMTGAALANPIPAGSKVLQ